jgi:hypothetical protein
MPIDSGQYCQYCADESGKLHGFEETVERMSQFMARQEPGLSPKAATAKTLDYMAGMPAWKNHPGLKARRG